MVLLATCVTSGEGEGVGEGTSIMHVLGVVVGVSVIRVT